MSTLVVYFSRGGHVAKVAKQLAYENEYALEEIVETQNRKGVFGFITGGADASLKRCGEILNMHSDISSFDKIILCSPVWAGTMPPAVRAFLVAHADDIKDIEYIIMRASRKNEYTEVFAQMNEIIGKTASKTTSLAQPAPNSEKTKSQEN